MEEPNNEKYVFVGAFTFNSCNFLSFLGMRYCICFTAALSESTSDYPGSFIPTKLHYKLFHRNHVYLIPVCRILLV